MENYTHNMEKKIEEERRKKKNWRCNLNTAEKGGKVPVLQSPTG